jgi:NAD(P)H-hydrate epimerase
MARADAHAIQHGRPGYSLMLSAGKAVAAAAVDMLGPRNGRRVMVFCGPGNNGGDGYVAARLLQEMNFQVLVGALGDTGALRGDAAQAFHDWPGETLEAGELEPRHADLVIDALFGAGLSRPLEGDALELVDRINSAHVAVLAVDVPSGMDGANGSIATACIRATETVTFFRLKPGHLLLPGRIASGKVRLVQIGIESSALDAIVPRLFLNTPRLWLDSLPVLRLDSHKYRRGHLLVASGPMFATGAARLAARAGLRAGAGLVSLVSPAEALAINAAQLTAIMLKAADGAAQWREILRDRRFSALVIGPGFGVGSATCDVIEAVLEAVEPGRRFGLVLDADSLMSWSPDWDNLARSLRNSGAEAVLTPHEGEFDRLFSKKAAIAKLACQAGAEPSSEIFAIFSQPSDYEYKIDRARAAARAVGATVVFKGPDSVVASPDGRAAIACHAPPTLATAGSGDVLAGLIGGLLAQGMPAFEAASCAVWLHGEAANLFGPGLISEDLPDMVPRVLANLASS